MPKMIVSIDGVVIKEVQLTKERTSLGRRPYNDIVIDNLAVSGEHAVLHMSDDEVEIEDLGSTNGTYVNGKAAKRQALRNGDTVEVGKYKIRFHGDNGSSTHQATARSRCCARGPGVHPRLDGRRRRTRGGIDQGGHHHRQAGSGCRIHHAQAPGVCAGPC